MEAFSIEEFNKLTSAAYFSSIFDHASIAIPRPSGSKPRKPADPAKNHNQHLEFTKKVAAELQADDFCQCLRLIQESSRQDYEKSSVGWSPRRKSAEMRLPDLRYVLLTGNNDNNETRLTKVSSGAPEKTRRVHGFMSFMLTYEDGIEVIYLYEIHLAEVLRKRGVGSRLLELLEQAGRTARVRKAMLTVFRANTTAVEFYEKRGYVEDDYSPRPRKLRGGKTVVPDYVILSKDLGTDDSRPGKRKRK